MENINKLTEEQQVDLMEILTARFEKNMHRHPTMLWKNVLAKLEADPSKLWSLNEMERTGGEPDVVMLVSKVKGCYFVDCSAETPRDRRSMCYDRAALDARKENKPSYAALDIADSMGVTILNEEQYRLLQKFDVFDTKTSSWIITPPHIREQGGALFCDRRYDTVFVYHNSAESYYAVRGFRAFLSI